MATKLAAVGVSLAGLVFALPEQSRFTSRTDLVTVYASVLSRGAPVWTLDRGDFEVIVDGRKRDIVQFAREAQPLKTAIVLDRSGSYFKDLRVRVPGRDVDVRAREGYLAVR